MIAFSGNPLDRASAKREDAAWLAQMRGQANARVLTLWKLQPLLLGPENAREPAELGFLSGAAASQFGAADAVEIFLGLDGAIPYFARDATDNCAVPQDLLHFGHFRDARAATGVLSSRDVALLGQAKALIDWHNRYGHCSCCGAATTITSGGYRRICPACKAEHFPRTDPAVIMLVTAGERCLLGRNKRFTGGHYSTLAGFIEPGETIEEAVRREVYEEVRVRVGAVRYFSSQPWPFPSNLMIGCFADADSHEIEVDGEEILAARWFDRDIIKRAITGDTTDVLLPRHDAIAHHLIRTWAEEG